MKKIGLICCILFISLISTACINNLAIQELNEMGKKYLEQGDIENAIARFQSSVDLDENIFESRYNLGVAYIKNEEYLKAIKTLEKAAEMKPELPDVHYSLAIACEGEALNLEENEVDENVIQNGSESVEDINDEKITPEAARDYLDYAQKAIKEYQMYLKLSKQPNDEDKSAIDDRIVKLKKLMAANCKKYKINPAVFSVSIDEYMEDSNEQ